MSVADHVIFTVFEKNCAMIWRWLDFCENRCCANCFEGQPMRRVQFAAKTNSLFDISKAGHTERPVIDPSVTVAVFRGGPNQTSRKKHPRISSYFIESFKKSFFFFLSSQFNEEPCTYIHTYIHTYIITHTYIHTF